MLEARPQWTPLDVLETEARYPGLIDDLFVFSWQDYLIKKQLDENKK